MSFLLHVGSTVLCLHGGQAQPAAPNPRVLLGGQPAVTLATTYLVAGCPFTVGTNPLPCLTAQWLIGAVRVFAGGQPVLVQSGQAVCTPTGTGLQVVATQLRVRAQ